ncbi:MAG: asparagine synthase (glutamine-hydrolyzing) [Sphingomonas sp.]
MCGVAGYFAFSSGAGFPSRDTLVAMRDHMTRRGPDGAGLWFSEGDRVGFAHRRLSIIDLSDCGSQPMASADGRTIITYNGEIYNFRALRQNLEERGHTFRSGSDTEVLLQLYASCGLDMFSRLRGMFALAIWDGAQERLILARDPYGIKPLYYAEVDGCVRFASQVKALRCDPAIPTTRSAAGLVGFHIMGSVPEPFTLFEAIRSIPAGSTMIIDVGGARTPRRYESLPAIIANGRHRSAADVDVGEALRDSVRHHLVSDVPVGVFLSGGTDSAAIIGLMRDCGQQGITACTLTYPEMEGLPQNEVPRASKSAGQYGVHHHIRRVTRSEFQEDLPAILSAMDQPSIDGINTWFVSKAMRELGLKVALSGMGGDELFAGYSTFKTVPRAYRWAGAVARSPAIGRALTRMIDRSLPWLTRQNPKIMGLFTLSDTWGGSYMLRRSVLLPGEVEGVLGLEMAEKGLADLQLAAMMEREITPDPGSDVGRVTALESSLYMRNQLLRDADWAGMAHSVEIRVPFVDIELLRRISPLLPNLRDKDGKRLVANAPSIPVSTAITEHARTGFSIPVGDWLEERGKHVEDRLQARRWARQVITSFQPN